MQEPTSTHDSVAVPRERTMAESPSHWPVRPDASGKPNIVVILVDDLGFADLGSYGSEIDTPHLDRLAAEGIRYTDFHVTPMCSPTRAALLTGRNSHSVGFGTVFGDPGFPGYTHELPADAITMAEVFGESGYRTLMVGKWHLCKDTDRNEGGPQHSWPIQRGFDRFYGFLDAFTNLHHPHRLFEDNHAIDVDSYPDDYYFTDDITERAISMVRGSKTSNPDRPFFLYFAHGAVHGPLHAPAEDMARYRGRYDAGWDEIRDARFEKQLSTGIIPPETRLAPRNEEPGRDVRAWNELSEDEQRVNARHMEAYAAMVGTVDESFGRLRAALEDLGEWDNTIILFTSDNGASGEGHPNGTTRYMNVMGLDLDVDEVARGLERLDLIGGPRIMNHYPRGWAMTSNTPFRLYKREVHGGGHRVPLIMRIPGSDAQGELRDQYLHVIDVLPTLAQLAGVSIPEQVKGRSRRAIHGRSFAGTIRSRSEVVRREQYYEMNGNRGYYQDGWEIVTLRKPGRGFSDDEWALHDLAADPTELVDLAAQHPERVTRLADAWRRAAHEYDVFPLDEGLGFKSLLRPAYDDVYSTPITLRPGYPSLERARSNLLILDRDFTIRITGRYRRGDEGYLFSHGDQGFGYGICVIDDHAWLVHTSHGDTVRVPLPAPLSEGTLDLTLDVVAERRHHWHMTLRATSGQQDAAVLDAEAPPGRTPFEGIDVGLCRRSPLDWSIYEEQGTFAWTGESFSVAITPGSPGPDAAAARLERLRASLASDD